MKLVRESLESKQEESQFTQEQKNEIEKFIKEYKGNFEDEELHTFAESLGLDVHEVEEYIYGMARGGKSSEDGGNKKGFHSNIEKDTIENNDFRKVLYTGQNLQLVLMILKPGEEIGEETHDTIDQFFRFEEGTGKCIINDNEYELTNGDVIIIPAGAKHNIINVGSDSLKMYTIYSPPNHKDKVTFETKEDAEASNEKFDGTTTE